MTKDFHRDENIELNENALQSLYNLSAVCDKICISGEGDPLANWQAIPQIIGSNPINVHYELITSSYWARNKTKSFLQELDLLCSQKKSTLSYRISVDQFHAEQTERDVLETLIAIFLSNDFKNISLQIRSVTGQEGYLFDRIAKLMNKHFISFYFHKINDLESEIITSKFNIKIQFKPTVNPSEFNYIDNWTIDKYIEYIERRRGVPFHIGLLNDSLSDPLFDITINPNGDLVLYGAEPFTIGNITKEIFSCEMIAQKIRMNEDLSELMSYRFVDLIHLWRRNKQRAILIDRINNPFWIVRNLYKEKLLPK
ncbi:MAG TPA: hypothetical protein VF421_20220 [Niabella sp.]